MAVFALVAWPFTAWSGVLDVSRLMIAVVFGVVWLALALLTWRLRSPLLYLLHSVLLILGSKEFGIRLSALPISEYLQWFLTVIIVAGMPLFLMPSRFLRLAKIDTFPPPFRESEHL
jgi:hypothetical protein